MTVRDGIYAVPAFIANTLIRCVVTGRVPAEGKEADYINTLCEHYKFILTVFQKRSIYPIVRIRRRRANKIRRTSKEETSVSRACSRVSARAWHGLRTRRRRCEMTLTAGKRMSPVLSLQGRGRECDLIFPLVLPSSNSFPRPRYARAAPNKALPSAGTEGSRSHPFPLSLSLSVYEAAECRCTSGLRCIVDASRLHPQSARERSGGDAPLWW